MGKSVAYTIISLIFAIPFLYFIHKIDQPDLTDKEYTKYFVGYLISGLVFGCVDILLIFVDMGIE